MVVNLVRGQGRECIVPEGARTVTIAIINSTSVYQLTLLLTPLFAPLLAFSLPV
jgi:hypothetical protein